MALVFTTALHMGTTYVNTYNYVCICVHADATVLTRVACAHFQ